ncbi:TM2 domain-containing protein [Methylorubrum extorquens]
MSKEMRQWFNQHLTIEEKMLVEQQVTNQSRSILVAYAFWLFAGLLSAHRFYLGRPGSAILQILCNIFIIGLLWTLIDFFLIPGIHRANQEELRMDLARNLRRA